MAGDGRVVRGGRHGGDVTGLADRVSRLRHDPLRLVVGLIGGTTVVAGLVQAVAPGFMLDILGAESTATTRHFFAIVGMFMAVVGGAVVHAVLADGDHPIVILWGGIQKIGAVVGVLAGVIGDVFSALALAVVVFDAVSAVISLWYWRRIR